MEAREAGAALGQTGPQLQGGVSRQGIASVTSVIVDWERTLGATSLPELAPLAENLRALRSRLSPEDSEPMEAGRLLLTLGDRVRAVAPFPCTSLIAASLAQPSLLLTTGGSTIAAQSAAS